MTTPARRSTPRTTAAPASARTSRTGMARAGNVRTATTSRPHLWVVPDGGPARRARTASRRRAPFVLLVVALLVGTTLGLLFLNTAIAVDSLKATQLRTGNAQRVEEVQRLEQQVVNGRTPAELAGKAVAAGMVPAGPPAYLVIEPDGSSEVRGTPESASGPTPGEQPPPSQPAGPLPDAGGD